MKVSDSKHHPIFPVVLGVDAGGSKVAAALVDSSGRLFGATRQPTDISTPQATLDSIAKTIEECLNVSGIQPSQLQGAGLGVPGLVDSDRGIGVASANLGWREVPVRDELEKRIGITFAIENDVRAAALGEARFGAGRGVDHLLFLSIGTGIAATFVIQKSIYRGAHDLAGEIGHAVLEPGGRQCKCGDRGCFEALAAGPAIAARYLQKVHPAGERMPLDINPETDNVTAETVFRLAARGDIRAVETIQETADYVAHALQFLALAYDPRVIVIAGGVSMAGDQLLHPVRKYLQRRSESNMVLSKLYTPSLVQPSRLGKEIGVLGASALVAPRDWVFDQISLSEGGK